MQALRQAHWAEGGHRDAAFLAGVQVWMYAIVLLTLSSRQPSAKSVQRYLADIDEAYFTKSAPDLLIPGKLKRGSGSQRKAKVVVIAESLTPDPMKLW